MLIDTHCHLDFPDFAPEQAEIIARAQARGVKRMITISTHLSRFEQVKAVAEKYENVFFTVGTHPHHAHEEVMPTVEDLVSLSRHPKCVGLGEAGLDYHYDTAPRDISRQVFLTHIEAARQTGLPLVIHTRDADEDCATILKEEMSKGVFKALLHCFTSGEALAHTAIGLGVYISFSGVLTFKNSQPLREIAKKLPLSHLLVETDAPFLAPIPHRGKRNEPAYVVDTARVLAEIKEIDEAALARQTTENALRLFSKIPPLEGAT
jgi:TatD DNase family protein